MSLAIQTLPSGFTAKAIRDLSVNATQVNAVSGSATIYAIRVDNTANSAEAVYLKVWDSTSVTVGTTVADFVIGALASDFTEITIPDGGTAMATGITYAVVTSALETGNANPSDTVKVTILYT